MVTEAGKLRGIMLGTAVGDSVGLPAEGLSRARIARLGWKGNWRQRLTKGRGMMSDDTEQTIFVAQAMLGCGGDVRRFQRMLAWKLRLWLLGVPAGIGLGTFKAILKLWCGARPTSSGVMSAGNGAAMRSAIIGGRYYDDPARIADFVASSALVTHRDNRALVGAMAVARAAALSMTMSKEEKPDVPAFLDVLKGFGSDDEWQRLVTTIRRSLAEGRSVAEFAVEMGAADGVSGYVYQTVPVALYSWLANWGDFRKTLSDALDCGGDTDTVGAIAGALAGAVVGEEEIPQEWIDVYTEDDAIPVEWGGGFQDWPRSTKVMQEIADRLAAQRCGQEPGQARYFWPAIPLRNAVFLAKVLWHAAKRCVPDGWRRERK
jgi:ADP-ribosyl-[dinitrogen reductase] hydrolase